MPQHAEHFDDLQQQEHAASLGMWVFLGTELLLFGGLFLAYTVYRIQMPEAFHQASSHLYLWLGVANTAILLLSSVTMAMADHACEQHWQRSTVWLLLATIGFGIVFLAIKGFEYYFDWQESIVPGLRFNPSPFSQPNAAQLFFTLYFIMTGLHAFHMLVAIFIVLVLAGFVHVRGAEKNADLLRNVGLYWHFVDIVWIFLLPLLYLIAL